MKADDHDIELLGDIVRAILDRHTRSQECQYEIATSRALHAELGSVGFHSVMEGTDELGISESQGARLVRSTGWAPVLAPIAESTLAAWLLRRCRLRRPAGIITIGVPRDENPLRLTRTGNETRVQGDLHSVPFAAAADWVLTLARSDGTCKLVMTQPEPSGLEHGTNLAGESRDTVRIDAALGASHIVDLGPDFGPQEFRAAAAGMRTQQIAGALARVQSMTVRHARTRVQFGKPLISFQAVQQSLAVLVSEVAAATAAADLAASAFERPSTSVGLFAAAKSRAGEAIEAVAAIAHQLHGAMGASSEFALGHYTKRLLAWRQEFGNDRAWQEVLGRHLVDVAVRDPWPALVEL